MPVEGRFYDRHKDSRHPTGDGIVDCLVKRAIARRGSGFDLHTQAASSGFSQLGRACRPVPLGLVVGPSPTNPLLPSHLFSPFPTGLFPPLRRPIQSANTTAGGCRRPGERGRPSRRFRVRRLPSFADRDAGSNGGCGSRRYPRVRERHVSCATSDADRFPNKHFGARRPPRTTKAAREAR